MSAIGDIGAALERLTSINRLIGVVPQHCHYHDTTTIDTWSHTGRDHTQVTLGLPITTAINLRRRRRHRWAATGASLRNNMNDVFVYDPASPPDAAFWGTLSESQRITAVVDYHRQSSVWLANETVHAVMHVVIENQIATGVAPVVDTLSRLARDGLDRHEAIHAVGSVLAAHLHGIAPTEQTQADLQQAYFERLENLCAVRWQKRTA